MVKFLVEKQRVLVSSKERVHAIKWTRHVKVSKWNSAFRQLEIRSHLVVLRTRIRKGAKYIRSVKRRMGLTNFSFLAIQGDRSLTDLLTPLYVKNLMQLVDTTSVWWGINDCSSVNLKPRVLFRQVFRIGKPVSYLCACLLSLSFQKEKLSASLFVLFYFITQCLLLPYARYLLYLKCKLNFRYNLTKNRTMNRY